MSPPNSPAPQPASGKENHSHHKGKLASEMRSMLLMGIFLSFYFCSFTAYKRLLFAESGFEPFLYGYAILEGFLLAKVILIGKFLKLGERSRPRPLGEVVLYKAFIFALFVLFFALGEEVVKGIIHHKGFAVIYGDVMARIGYEFLSRFFMTFTIFVPFFSFLELGDRIGEETLFNLFFKKPLQ
jgi:hypothetical protein